MKKKITVLCLILCVCLVVTGILGYVLLNKKTPTEPGDSANTGNLVDPTNPVDPLVAALSQDEVIVNQYQSVTQVGVAFEQLGTIQRVKPVAGAADGGLVSGYPTYGVTKSLTTEQKDAIITEARSLCGRNTWVDVNTKNGGTYDKMDSQGFLYLRNGNPVVDSAGNLRRLYKHSAAVGMYGGDVADNEPGVIKKVTFRKRSYSSYYNVTGVYAPAGEVIKIQISEKDMQATGGIIVHIGQALYNGQANNIWNAKNFNRMPVILNTMSVDKDTATLENGVYTAYVGSFLGGPIYIRDENVTFSVTISGAVNYPHFILGVTTPAQFEIYRQSSAPIFDLEVWDSGVLHSGPKSQVAKYSYQDLYNAAVLWEKIALVATKVTNQGVVFLYDPFVAAGAAVAFPGRRSVNCPTGWMANALNYDAFVTSGSWGNIHEYHHNFQGGWGIGYTGEVTNNALNLITYSLFTKISAARQLGGYGGAGLSGWNTYTSASWALNQVRNGAITSTNGLSVYATLMHNFGQDVFVKAAAAKASGVNYLNQWQNLTHYNFAYFNSLIAAYVGEVTPAAVNDSYPMFVPMACVYQTGRSYVFDGQKKYIQTMQPFMIPYGTSYQVDLSQYTVNAANQYEKGSVVLPNGFTCKVKTVDTSEVNGTFVREAENVYRFTPNEQLNSGKIKVTFEVTKTDHAFEVADIELVLEFQQSHENKKAILERSVYVYPQGALPASAVAAFESNYQGSIQTKKLDNINPTQNSNTDVWMDNAGYDEVANSVMEVSGKLYVAESGKYRVVLRGRHDVALYLSFDQGATFVKAAHKVLTNTNHTTSNTYMFVANNDYIPGTYYDFEAAAGSWVYFKEVMLCEKKSFKNQGSYISFIGLGWAKFTVPQFTTKTDVDADGNIVAVHYYDGNGNEVTAEQASETTPIAPSAATFTTNAVYATAYRNSYEFTKQFQSDYFCTKEYNYSYVDNDTKFLGQNSNQKSPDNAMFTYRGNWSSEPVYASFGHVYVGQKDACLEFEFTGTRFLIIASKYFGSNYTVYLDGVQTDSLPVKDKGEDLCFVDYLSPELELKQHRVVIWCQDESSFDSICLY